MLITLPQVRDGQITARRLRQSFSWGETRYIGNTDRWASAHHKDIRWVRRLGAKPDWCKSGFGHGQRFAKRTHAASS
jgi:hypothetical protein